MMDTNFVPVILLVDDQPANLKLLHAVLNVGHYNFLEARDGKEAVDIASTQPVDLILMDVLMPVMDGFEAAHILRAKPDTSRIPIIFISALTDTADKVRAFDAGAIDYLTKPINPNELIIRVKTQLDLGQKRRENEYLLKQTQQTVNQLEQEIALRGEAESELYVVNKRLSALNKFNSLTHNTLNSNKVLEMTCEQISSATNAPLVFAIRVNLTTSPLYFEVTYPKEIKSELQEALNYQELQHLMLQIEKQDAPILFQSPNPNSWMVRAIKAATNQPLCRIMVGSIIIGGRLGAIIGACRFEPYDFDSEDEMLCNEICKAATQALDNSLLHEQLGRIVNDRTEQLNRLNQRTNAILANVSDSIIVLDANGNIDNTNPGFDRRFDYGPDALFGKPINVLAIDEEQELLLNAFRNVKSNQPRSLQLKMKCRDGQVFDADVSIALIKSQVDANQYVLTCHDITSFKELERLKDSFVSMVTHELRTPIAGIQLIANQLFQYDDRMEKPMRLRKVEQLITQSRIMAELIESVLDIARLENRRLKAAPIELVNMGQLLQKTVDEQSPISNAKQQTLSITIDEETPPITGDNDEAGRIWRNLISNAIKYTPDGGSIRASLGWVSKRDHFAISPVLELPSVIEEWLDDGDYVVGQVNDNGHGMDTNQLVRLFTRFDRGWARQSKIPGTGLGLALVKELIQAYGGNIHVESALNEGSSFTFWLPITTREEHVS